MITQSFTPAPGSGSIVTPLPVYTESEQALARELHAVGVAAREVARKALGMPSVPVLPTFDKVDDSQKHAWYAIARHLGAGKGGAA